MPARRRRWTLGARAGLSADILKHAGRVLARELTGGRQLTRRELYMALDAGGIATRLPAGEQRGAHILGHWAMRGLICITPRRGKQHTMGLVDEWVPPGRELSGDEALAEIAGRYFASHGPATVRDFAWWSGLTITEAKRGLQLVERRFEHEEVEGAVHWFPPDTRSARPGARGAYLLPPFDEYTVAYADRGAVIDAAQLRAAQHGIGSNIIIDGRFCGTWKRILEKDRVVISTGRLGPLDKNRKKALAAAVSRYGAFLERKAVLA